ncbi:MAG: penicillin-binding transpeptidase domain-containing protein [Oscillospiraceae bacterium]|nr:penicillin-binding transpeptidase domain-containing protein [Oscillospiraceae bacterium]
MRLAREEKKGRFVAMVIIFVCLTAVFVFTLAKNQIIDGKTETASNTASVETTEVKATRGQIFDRNGNVIVGNRQGNDVVFNAAEFPEYSEQEERNKLIKSLIDLFEKNNVEWNDDMPIVLDANGNYQFAPDREKDIATMKSRDILRLNKYATADDCMNELIERYKLESYSKSDARKIASVCYEMKINNFNSANPYTFATDVSDLVASVIKENSLFYKGVDVQIANYREYTDGTLAPHIIGVTGVISAEEYAELKNDGYGMDDIVGKTGIEQLYEKQLKGKNGKKIVTTALDGTQTVVTEGLENGDNVFLTLDAGLQKVTQDALADKINSLDSANKGGGAAVVMNCKTGEILAIATYPSYDLNSYYKDYDKLVKDANSPLYNRALLSTYAPGSTAKVSTAIGILEEGVADENSTIECTGTYKYGLVCNNNPDITTIDMRTAIQDSCNIYFYHFGGELLGIEKMNIYREMLGLGQPTGIELYENTGVLDSPSYRASLGQKWQTGFSLQSAIGQAGNLFTPLQLCNYVSTIANGGTRYSAHIIKSVYSADNSTLIEEKKPEVVCETGFKKKNVQIIKEGMRRVATVTLEGKFDDSVVEVACKTGTSTVEKTINGKKGIYTNGFLITFAPYDDPEICVALAVEGAYSGGSLAPIASSIYNYYYNNQVSIGEDNDVPEEEKEPTEYSELLR